MYTAACAWKQILVAAVGTVTKLAQPVVGELRQMDQMLPLRLGLVRVKKPGAFLSVDLILAEPGKFTGPGQR